MLGRVESVMPSRVQEATRAMTMQISCQHGYNLKISITYQINMSPTRFCNAGAPRRSGGCHAKWGARG